MSLKFHLFPASTPPWTPLPPIGVGTSKFLLLAFLSTGLCILFIFFSQVPSWFWGGYGWAGDKVAAAFSSSGHTH